MAESKSAAAADPNLHEKEIVIELEDVETPIEFDVETGKNRLVIRIRPPRYRFSV